MKHPTSFLLSISLARYVVPATIAFSMMAGFASIARAATCPQGTTYADGCAAAPAGTVQHPMLFSGYPTRPPWNVAGVDYPVGLPAGTVLKDPTIAANLPAGASADTTFHWIRVTANNVTLDGFDFSLHGGYGVYIQSGVSNTTITDSNFVAAPNLTPISAAFGTSNLYVAYNTFNGNKGDTTYTAETIQTFGSGITVEYNYGYNLAQHIVNTAGGPIVYKYNLFEDSGWQLGAHHNYLQSCGYPSCNTSPFTQNNPQVDFNTIVQHVIYGATPSEGLQMEGTFTQPEIINGEIGNNTIIASPTVIGSIGSSSSQPILAMSSLMHVGGTPVSATGSVHDNFMDPTSSYFSFYANASGSASTTAGFTFSNNIDLTNCKTIAFDNSESGGCRSTTPTVTLTASPTSITSGQSSTLTWSSANATSCTGTGFTAGNTSGSVSVSPTATQTYSITCTGAGGSASASATVTVVGVGVPVWTLTQSSLYANSANTAASLSDNSALTGVGTLQASGSWVQLTASSPVTTGSLTVRQMDPASPGGWGIAYINGSLYQYYNGSSWVTLATISGLTNGGPAMTLTYPPVTATQFRIYQSANNWLGVGEFIVNPSTVNTTPPTVPTNLSGTAISSSQINLTWTASTDNVAVAGYNIYRNGVQVGTSATNSYSDTSLTANTAYTYTVSAYDAVPNTSAKSSSVSVTTLSAATTPTLTTSPSSVAPGGSVTATWSGIATPSTTDWIGVYTPGSANTAYGKWLYTSSCTTVAGGTAMASGNCKIVMPTTAGSYELRLFANNGFTRLATSPSVTVATPLTSATVTVLTSVSLDPCPTGPVTMSSGSLNIGDCRIPGNVTLSGPASIHVKKGTVSIAGNLTLAGSAVFSVDNATLTFPQTNESEYYIDLSGSSRLTFNGATLITNGTPKNHFSMTLNARDTSALSVSSSSLDTALSWLFGNFVNNSTLTANSATNIPTENYPSDFSQLTITNSTLGGMWLNFVPSSSANVTLPVVDSNGHFNLAFGPKSGTNITYKVAMTNSRADLLFISYPNSTLHLTGGWGTNPPVTIGYYIVGNSSPLTVSGLTVGFIASKTLTDLGRSLSLTNVTLVPFGWQVYAQDNAGGLVTIQNSFINELGAFQNSNVKVANSTLQLALLAAAAPTSQVLVDGSQIWSNVVEAVGGGHMTIQNSTIHGNFFSSSGCSGGKCSTITLTNHVTEANNGTQPTCSGVNIFKPDGTPNCNPQNPLQASSTFITSGGGIINR